MNTPKRTEQRTDLVREGMQICPDCRSELVQPIEWWERDEDNWAVELRCPECEWHGGGVFSQPQVDRYDRALDEGSRVLATDLRILTRENMESETNSFAAALASGAILPEDF